MKWVVLLVLVLVLALGAAACGGNSGTNNPPKDAGAGSDASMPPQDAGADAAGNPFASCIDRPDQADTMVPRPPTAGLPCDLVPPTALH